MLEILSYGLGCILVVSDLVPFPRPDWREPGEAGAIVVQIIGGKWLELDLGALQWSQGVCDDPFTFGPPEKYPLVGEEE